MNDLIVKHLSGTATDIEERTLERWRAESPDNEAEYRSVEALWGLVGDDAAAPNGAAAQPVPPDPAAIIGKAEARRGRSKARAGRRALMRSPWLGYAVAAAAVLALVIARMPFGGTADGVPLLAPVGSTASAGNIMTMSLSDGSVVRLADHTSISFPPSSEARDVVLQGRAFFAVAHGDEPFRVRTAMGDVTVHGTRFEVRTSEHELRVVVLEGVVEVANGTGTRVELHPGEVARIGPDGRPVVAAEDVWSLLDWTGGLLVFQETPLADVAEEIGRHFGRSVSVDEGLRAVRVTAWFGDEGVDEVVSGVCLVAGASCDVTDAQIRIGS